MKVAIPRMGGAGGGGPSFCRRSQALKLRVKVDEEVIIGGVSEITIQNEYLLPSTIEKGRSLESTFVYCT